MKSTPHSRNPRILVLGTGIAGLSTALKFANSKEREFDVTLVSKGKAIEGATRWAQGGIAAVWSKDDSIQEHVKDTLVAGADLCHEDIVRICVEEGPERVRELISLGVEFTRASATSPDFDLHREGGHGQRRILHADDLTGLAIEKALLNQIARHPRIQLLEDHSAIDLITDSKALKKRAPRTRALGAYVLNNVSGKIETYSADLTVLATGGAGKVYLYTSNPDTATGDGIAMAYRAGAKVANLEFIQFHPTCLYHPNARTFLITEALRGEGAVLKNLRGESFMDRHHSMGSLAPRDVVARAIDMEIKRTGDKHVWLDCSSIGAEKLRTHFPNIYETCLNYGVDITKGLVPVVPAAHYTCGGVVADEWAQTTIEGLYAVGEVACTGLHGANRLASNSLLEAVVFADRVYRHGLGSLKGAKATQNDLPSALPEWQIGHAVEIEEQIDIAATWREIRELMWNYVGIVRSNRRLERAKRRLATLKMEINEYYWDYLLTRDLIELRNLVQVADLIVTCATLRHESRGLHYTMDYPSRDDAFYKQDTVL